VFITIKISNSWIKIDNNSAEKFLFLKKNLFYFVVLKQKKHVLQKRTFFKNKLTSLVWIHHSSH